MNIDTIKRFSSRRERLDHAFLSKKLAGAKSYRRIAGYFRSSIFELVGEEIAGIPKVQIVCNSELDAAAVAISQHVRETALKERWNEAPAEVEALLHKDRYRQLYDLLVSGRVEIRVVPKDRVFIHGNAGVIEAANGSKTCFLGSINETKSAFALNYEILWEDQSPEASHGWRRNLTRSGKIPIRCRMPSSRKSNASPTAWKFALMKSKTPSCPVRHWPERQSIAAANSFSRG
jgi:hypothetical protein